MNRNLQHPEGFTHRTMRGLDAYLMWRREPGGIGFPGGRVAVLAIFGLTVFLALLIVNGFLIILHGIEANVRGVHSLASFNFWE
jgi:hypothetical protein